MENKFVVTKGETWGTVEGINHELGMNTHYYV